MRYGAARRGLLNPGSSYSILAEPESGSLSKGGKCSVMSEERMFGMLTNVKVQGFIRI